MTTPVLITAFRRPDFLKRVLSCFHDRSNPIYVWLNGPSNSYDEQSILECHTVIRETSANVVFVKTNFEHFPSGQSIINAIDWVFSLESSAIILEDDIVVSEAFIEFMDFSIEYFKPLESGVGSIVGSCFVPHERRSASSLRKSVFTSSWGWGTWKNRWVEFDRNLIHWDTKKAYLPLLLRDLPSRSRFNSIYRSIKAGTFDAWDYRWQFTNWKQGWITIAPNTNLVMNIGFDNRSTHTFSAPSWVPKTFENYSLEPQDFSNVPYDKVGDEWYKSNVLGLNYSYFLRTKIRTAINLCKKCLKLRKAKDD